MDAETAEVVPVLILSYQRCGSSFFGGLFDMAPKGFHIFEPLDSLYSAMYGTYEGWNVPADIMNYRNGTIRYAGLQCRIQCNACGTVTFGTVAF